MSTGGVFLTHSLEVNASLEDCEIWPQEAGDIFYVVVQSIVRYLEGVDYEYVTQTDRQTDRQTYGRTDGQTDILFENAALHYVTCICQFDSTEGSWTYQRADALCAWLISSDPLKKSMTFTQRGRRRFADGGGEVGVSFGEFRAAVGQTRAAC